MKAEKLPLAADANEEIAALIETLNRAEQRLEALTAGEVDTVTDRDGRTLLLRRAQNHMRHNEAAKQAAILNALPANIALLDTHGRIRSVNEAWRRFDRTNAIQCPGYEIGLNYLDICDRAPEEDASMARQAAAGIRSVLDGTAKHFSLESPCHSPTQQRWFQMSVTPLSADRPVGVVIMYLDVTAERLAEENLHVSELQFREMAAHIRDVFFLVDAENDRILYISPACEAIWGRSCESLYTNPESWFEATHPDDRASADEKYQQGLAVGKAEFEFRIVRTDGSIRWIQTRMFPVRDDTGKIVRIAGIAQDITRRKRNEEEIAFKNTILQTQQETSLDAILVVDENGKILSSNQKFIDLWRLPPQLLNARLDAPVLQSIANQVEHSAAFSARVQYLNAHHDDKSHEELSLKDGRIIDRYSAPVTGADGKHYGRVWYFRDISERKKTEQKFKDLLESAPDAMVIVNRDAEIVLLNVQAINLFGWSRGALLGQKIETLLPERFRSTHPASRNGFFTQPRARSMGPGLDLFGLRKDGSEFPVEISLSPLETNEGTLVIAAIRDITERKKTENRIAYLNRVHAVLSSINTLIVRVRDRNELFREACRIAVETGGFRMAMLYIVDRSTMKIVQVASAGKDKALLSSIKDLVYSSEEAPESLVARAIGAKEIIVSNDTQSDPRDLSGKQYAESGVRSMAIFPLIVADEAVGAIALHASEIEFFHEEEMHLLTELAGDIAFAIDHIEKQERLNYLAYYDVLTGLANRSLFLERVAQYMRSAVNGEHKLAIGLIDLERFKNINDSLGRSAGDELLKQVVEWLKQKTGDINLLARIDADHFAIVLPDVKSDGNLARLIENLLEAFLRHSFLLNEVVFRISAKAGIALFPDDGADVETLFKNAEAALKKAKASGERYLFYTQKLTEAVAGKLTLENQLRQALDNEEFVLHYQPKVNLASGKLTSAEALIRWNDPRTGLVPPGRFIPVMEETGLIHEVGRWALRQAINDALRWRAAGLPAVRIAVNVSPLQLRNINFIDEIKQLIALDAHAAASLELEITESVIMENIEHNIAILQAIRALGVTIAIDDFGTGFSSLSYLARLPVDTLKIDRSFVIGMTVGDEGLSLVSTIINLAHSLKLKVVAEGVETEEQSRLLRLLRCNEMQGFLFSAAVPAELFATRFLAPPPAE